MTATTSNLETRQGQRMVAQVRRLALGVGSLLAAIGSRWDAIVESAQLGPDTQRSISRYTGGRI